MLSYPDLSPPGLGVRVAVAEVILVYPGLSQQDGAVVQRDGRTGGPADEGGTSCVQPDVADCFAGVGWFRSLNRKENWESGQVSLSSYEVFRPVEVTAEARTHHRDLSPAPQRCWCPSLSTPGGHHACYEGCLVGRNIIFLPGSWGQQVEYENHRSLSYPTEG